MVEIVCPQKLCFSRSRSRLLAPRSRALPWGLKCVDGGLVRVGNHWNRCYDNHGKAGLFFSGPRGMELSR